MQNDKIITKINHIINQLPLHECIFHLGIIDVLIYFPAVFYEPILGYQFISQFTTKGYE